MLNLYKILHLEKYIGYIYKTIYIVKMLEKMLAFYAIKC